MADMEIDERIVNRVPSNLLEHRDGLPVGRAVPHMTVFQQPRLRGEADEDAEDTRSRRGVEEAAKILNLERFLDGQAEALPAVSASASRSAAGIVREPAVFLMEDQPAPTLTRSCACRRARRFWRIQKRLGTTTVYVMNDQVEVLTHG